MKKVVTFFLKHWHLILGLLILGYSFTFLFTDHLIIYREDLAGHYQKALRLNYPHLIQGWDTTSWAGFSQDLYPSLYHLYLRTFLNRFPDTFASQTSTAIIVFMQIILFWFLSKKLFKKYQHQQLSFTLFLFTFFSLPNSFLGSLHGTLFVGGLPAALGLVFVTTYILLQSSSQTLQNHILKALLLGLSILTHTLSALFIGLMALFSLSFKNKGSILSLLLGLIIGLPWIWVFLNPYLSGSRINMPATITSSFIIIWILSLSIQNLIKKTHPYRHLIFPLLIIGLISSIPFQISDWLWKMQVTGFHFFRFQLFFFLFTPPILITQIKSLPQKSQSTLGLLSLSLLILLILLNLNPILNRPQIQIMPQARTITGRLLDTTNTKPFSLPHLTTTALSTFQNIDFATNFFFESSPLSPLFYSLTYSINPQTYLLGANKEIIKKTLDIDPDLIKPQDKLELLGINYLAHTQIPELGQDLAIPIINIFPPKSLKPETVYLIPTSTQPPIISLDQIPPISDQSFSSWWPTASINNLFIRQPIHTPKNINFSKPAISQIQINQQKISFNIDSTTPAPVLIKFTHNHYWQAFGQTSQPIPIHWVSPGFMLLIGSGPIKLEWQTPSMLLHLQTLSVITIISLSICFFVLSHPKIKHMHNQK